MLPLLGRCRTAADDFYDCALTQQSFNPDGFGTGKSYIGFNTVNDDASGSGTGFLFFEPGSFLANGVYNLASGTITDGTNFYGSFAPIATLTVRGIAAADNGVPAPATLALSALGLAALMMRRRR